VCYDTFIVAHSSPLTGKVDVGDAIENNVVEVTKAPTIVEVTRAMVIGLAITSAFFGLLALLVFAFILYHRKNIVMKLAQWQFLCWLVSCALVSYVFLFTFAPSKSWHCRVSNILEFIPITMIGAILIGRTWRVFITVSGASNIGRHETEPQQSKSSHFMKTYYVGSLTWLARFPYNCWEQGDKQSPSGFRQTATAAETARLIMWISLPQIVLQTVGVVVYDEQLEMKFDDDFTVGIVLCQDLARSLRAAGLVLAAITYFAAVTLAWASRDLPSAFNESSAVFQAATINSIVALMSVTLDQLTSNALVVPNIEAFLWAATSLIVVSTSVFFIVMPKVRHKALPFQIGPRCL
jgi:7 transmembrane sweet-taste receptor of 3 GCPR